jgi:hypothetical protein
MLVAVSVQWTQEGSSMFIQPPDTYRKDVLLNVPAKQTVQSLHQLAFTIINLLSYVALNTSNCSGHTDMNLVATCTFQLKLFTNTLEQLRECGGKASLDVILNALVENKAITDLLSVGMKPIKKRTKCLMNPIELQLNEAQATLACEFANILDIAKWTYCSNLSLEKSIQHLAAKLMGLVLTLDCKDADRAKLLSQLSLHVSEKDLTYFKEHVLKLSLDGRIDYTNSLVALMSAQKTNMSSAEFKVLLDLAIKNKDHAHNGAAQILQAAVEDSSFFNGTFIDYSLLVDNRSFESLLTCHMTKDIAELCAVLVRNNPMLGRQFGELWSNELLSSRELKQMKTSKLDLLPVVCAYFEQTDNSGNKAAYLLIKTYWPVINDQLLGSSCDGMKHLCSHLLSLFLPFMQTRLKHSKMKLNLLQSLCSSLSSQYFDNTDLTVKSTQ